MSAAQAETGGPDSAHRAIWDLSKPVIAAVKGYAVGQACELAGVCDFTVAAEDAKFGEIQIRHGYGPPFPDYSVPHGPQARERDSYVSGS